MSALDQFSIQNVPNDVTWVRIPPNAQALVAERLGNRQKVDPDGLTCLHFQRIINKESIQHLKMVKPFGGGGFDAAADSVKRGEKR